MGTGGFRAAPRQPADPGRQRTRILLEAERLTSRFDRAARDGFDEFIATDSDSRDIGMLAIINLADFVQRTLPEWLLGRLPADALAGLRATRNIAAHDDVALDNSRVWRTVTVHGPALLRQIAELVLAEQNDNVRRCGEGDPYRRAGTRSTGR